MNSPVRNGAPAPTFIELPVVIATVILLAVCPQTLIACFGVQQNAHFAKSFVPVIFAAL